MATLEERIEKSKKVEAIKEGHKAIPYLRQLMYQDIEVRGVSFWKGEYGWYAVVKLADSREYRTYSKSVVKKLYVHVSSIRNGGIRTKLVQRSYRGGFIHDLSYIQQLVKDEVGDKNVRK
jgi:hypothetical protein